MVWLSENLFSLLFGALLIAILYLLFRGTFKQKGKGCCGCSDCSGTCPHCVQFQKNNFQNSNSPKNSYKQNNIQQNNIKKSKSNIKGGNNEAD